jgi:hypothetical protein
MDAQDLLIFPLGSLAVSEWHRIFETALNGQCHKIVPTTVFAFHNTSFESRSQLMQLRNIITTQLNSPY